MTKTRNVPTSVFISDWDQTVTTAKGGTNDPSTRFGLDYIPATVEEIVQQYIVSGVADVLHDMLANDYIVMIATSQPMPQVIRRALVSLLGEKAKEVIIICGKPENLVYEFKRGGKRVGQIPLHTKDIHSVIGRFNKGNAAHGLTGEISDHWSQSYSKADWNAHDVAHMVELMDGLGVENIGIIESKKENYIWSKLKEIFPNPANCQNIIYVDDSRKRLCAFEEMRPPEFSATSLVCIPAIPDTNHHFISALEAVGRRRSSLSLSNVETLSAADASVLANQLNLTPVRLKKFSETARSNSFFVADASVKTLSNTIVKLADHHFMVIGNVPEAVSIGEHSKVKAQTTIKLSDDGKSFVTIGNGLVKIQFTGERGSLRQLFLDQAKREADLFARYNDLTSNDVQLQISEVHKGVRVYMTMPVLGVSLSNAALLSSLNTSARLFIFHATLKRVEKVHQGGHGHFDLALRNILYDKHSSQVHLCDFGLARALGMKSTKVSRLVNPPLFTDPVDNQLHFSAAYDVFSLGKAMAMLLGFSDKSSLGCALSQMFKPNVALGYQGEKIPEGGYDEVSSLLPPILHASADDYFNFANNPLNVEQEIITLLRQMLDADPGHRPSVAQCLARLEQLGVEQFVLVTPKF